MSSDSGLRSWLRGGGCSSSSTYYCVNLAEAVDWKPGQRWLLLFCNILLCQSCSMCTWPGWSMHEYQMWLRYQFQAFLIGFYTWAAYHDWSPCRRLNIIFSIKSSTKETSVILNSSRKKIIFSCWFEQFKINFWVMVSCAISCIYWPFSNNLLYVVDIQTQSFLQKLQFHLQIFFLTFKPATSISPFCTSKVQ
jgi:hypothetical protein